MSNYKDIFNKLQSLKRGKLYILEYESSQSGLRVSGKELFKTNKNYIIETKDYETYESVVLAKEKGLLKDGSSGKNELRIKNTFLYLNENTKIVKLRVPVISTINDKYFIRENLECEYNQVSKEKYYEEISKHGWKKRECVAQRFQSFNISKIKSIKEYKKK